MSVWRRVPRPILWIVCLFAITAAALSKRFPPLNTDEAYIANHGWNLVTGQGQRFSLYDDIFAPAVYPWRDAFAQVTETLTNGWVGLWLRVFGRHFWVARLACLGAALLAFWPLRAITEQTGGPASAFACVVLLAIDPVLLLAASVVRPETMLLALTSLVIWLILRLPPNFRWKRVLIGFLSGLLVAAHPNALALWPGIFIFSVIVEPPPSWGKFLAQSIAGLLCAALLMTGFFDLNILRLSAQTFHVELMRPPLLTWPWSAKDWLQNLLAKLYMNQTYYFSAALDSGWYTCLKLKTLGWGLLLLGTFQYFRTETDRSHLALAKAFAAGVLATWISKGSLVRKNDVLYALDYYPFLLPLVTLPLAHYTKIIQGTQKILYGLGLLFFVACPILFTRMVINYQQFYTPPTEVLQQFRSQLQDPHLKIVGPNIFWFDPAFDHFRDIGALTYSHWYTGGRKDIGAWLKGWKPDVLVTDETFDHLFLNNTRSPTLLSQVLGARVNPLGNVVTGEGSYGTMDVYRLTWPSDGT